MTKLNKYCCVNVEHTAKSEVLAKPSRDIEASKWDIRWNLRPTLNQKALGASHLPSSEATGST